MSPEQFAYWLQGFNEINQRPPTDAQWQIIVDHLESIFDKRTPLRKIQDLAAPLKPLATVGTERYPQPMIDVSALNQLDSTKYC